MQKKIKIKYYPEEVIDIAESCEPEDIEVVARWGICLNCDGDGHHMMDSLRDVAFTREEFDEQFDDEEQEMYFNGGYDQTCKVCNGSGKVLEPDYQYISEEVWRGYVKYKEVEENYRRERESELRWGY